jgi:hypothetical protein
MEVQIKQIIQRRERPTKLQVNKSINKLLEPKSVKEEYSKGRPCTYLR